ncbi:MAG: hypothetical protein IAG13_14340 [Deltaproteobacteria bacterium]|nr:hypothetical protein [Nannocystaceae bacterium]
MRAKHGAIWVLVASACGDEKNPAVDDASGSGTAEEGIVLDDSGTVATVGSVGEDTGDKLDVAVGTGSGVSGGDCMGGGGMMGENTFSIIWVANSPEGTVSKIDTETGAELGRYYTGPSNGEDDPSRTSVNLEGDVAVSNRGGGVLKFASETSRCIDNNGNGTIETSDGPGNVLPWGEDECMLWRIETPFDGVHEHGPRPTAWDAGAQNDPCQTQDDRLWIGWWRRDENVGHFERLDGADGTNLDTIDVEGFDSIDAVNDYGPYGGAVNAEGDLWTSGRSPGPLVHIDSESLEYTVYQVPEDSSPYGIAVDKNGHPWLGDYDGGVLHFDPDSETFEEIDTPNVARERGLMVDREGFAWVAGNNPCALVKIDTATRTLVSDTIALPDCEDPVGVSIDAMGFVWVVDRGAELAFKVDPVALTSVTVTGLVGPYTYSDMTGAGLGLVVNPPAG